MQTLEIKKDANTSRKHPSLNQVFQLLIGEVYLAENVNAFNPALIEYVNSSNGLNGVNALLGVESELQRQSAVLGMLGDFHYMALGVLCAIPMLLLLRPGKLGQSSHDAVMD